MNQPAPWLVLDPSGFWRPLAPASSVGAVRVFPSDGCRCVPVQVAALGSQSRTGAGVLLPGSGEAEMDHKSRSSSRPRTDRDKPLPAACMCPFWRIRELHGAASPPTTLDLPYLAVGPHRRSVRVYVPTPRMDVSTVPACGASVSPQPGCLITAPSTSTPVPFLEGVCLVPLPVGSSPHALGFCCAAVSAQASTIRARTLPASPATERSVRLRPRDSRAQSTLAHRQPAGQGVGLGTCQSLLALQS